jgi:hypothetical protein
VTRPSPDRTTLRSMMHGPTLPPHPAAVGSATEGAGWALLPNASTDAVANASDASDSNPMLSPLLWIGLRVMVLPSAFARTRTPSLGKPARSRSRSTTPSALITRPSLAPTGPGGRSCALPLPRPRDVDQDGPRDVVHVVGQVERVLTAQEVDLVLAVRPRVDEFSDRLVQRAVVGGRGAEGPERRVGRGVHLIQPVRAGCATRAAREDHAASRGVPGAGFEPARPFGQMGLSHQRLPFRQPGAGDQPSGDSD